MGNGHIQEQLNSLLEGNKKYRSILDQLNQKLSQQNELQKKINILLSNHANQTAKFQEQYAKLSFSNKETIKKLQAQKQATKKQFYQRQNKMRQDQALLQSQVSLHQQESQFQLKELQNQLRTIKDPAKMKQHMTVMKQTFWNELKHLEFKLYQCKSVIFIGKTSVGKSSLLNTLFKTNVPTSKMSCTKQISVVKTIGEGDNVVTIFDCPGLDQHFDLINDPYKIPTYMGCMSDIYYLYDGFIEADIITTFMAMNKRIFAVRTKCDPDQNPGENQQVRSNDFSKFKSIGYPTEVFLTSRKGGQDNQRLLKHIITPLAKPIGQTNSQTNS